ncbi:Sec23/Sec24 protein transport family protein isoform 2 [Hibiscus syriacus]|uniref:Protein transport protein SEC23 n=1 Tax=Hibiscus syriacus TaxID=106335 RepID=A0A6A3AHM1_HIBSY|nr:Sec23/Sec24 protein transport family protein isoform 2 [Hibiscus syriacus]
MTTPPQVSPPPNRDKSPITDATTISPGTARFTPPNLQPDQIASSSIKNPIMLSPENGVKTGSPIPHLSIPPGPPVFTMPVWPAAVPFRTSPATPQPVTFSSGSSLPTSSPPHFPNGSVELQQQLPGSIEDSVPAGESPCVLFSAHKVLKHKKLANLPSLGFGVLVSPGRETSTGEYVASNKEELRNFPELSSPLVDFIQTGNKRPSFVPVTDSRTSSPVVLVIDECLDESHLQHLQSSLHAFVDSVPPTTRIGIILYGRTVSVYDFSGESIASADVIPGGTSPTQESLKGLIYGTGIYLSPMHASKEIAHLIFSSLRPYKLNVPEASRDRCLGTAVEVAMAIIQGPSVDMSRGIVKRPGGNSRIIFCAGGPNTYGPVSVPHSYTHPNYPHREKTALKWMERLGRETCQHNIVIDVLCAGTCPVRVPVLQPLANVSGGVLVLHDDFGEAFGVVGPGEEAHIDNHETFENDISLCIQMLSVDETQCFSISLENKYEIKSDYVFFQFAIQYSNVYQADIARVITIRLPTVDSVSAYLQSVQYEAAAVIIAKRTLMRAKSYSDAIDMQKTIDERVKDIALNFGS